MKTLKAVLSPESIDNVVKYLEDNYKVTQTKAVLNDLLRIITNRGAEIVKEKIRLTLSQRGSTPSGNLENSVFAIVDMANGVGIIKVGAEYGAYVEFGTGIVGADNPAINASQHNWRYDVNEHGEAGWVYTPDDGETFYWTKGQKPTSFMLLSSVEIREFMDDLYKTYKFGGDSK